MNLSVLRKFADEAFLAQTKTKLVTKLLEIGQICSQVTVEAEEDVDDLFDGAEEDQDESMQPYTSEEAEQTGHASLRIGTMA
jgi:hypothetical protein